MPRSIVLALAIVAVASAPLAATEPERRGDASNNVLLTLTVFDAAANGVTSEHSVTALALDDRSARMATGWRLPIPERTFTPSGAGSGEGVPVTHFSYQEVGLAATLQGRIVGGGRVRVSGRVEVSAVDEEASAGAPAPSLGSFRHDFEVILTDAIEATVADVTKPGGGSLRLSLSAEIQD